VIILPGFGRIPPLASALPPEGSLPPGVLVTRPCACGTPVTASRHDPAPGVAAHIAMTAHRRWWARVEAEWQGEEAS
jgi:hypothetical protein